MSRRCRSRFAQGANGSPTSTTRTAFKLEIVDVRWPPNLGW